MIAVVAVMMNACQKQTLDRLSDLGLHDLGVRACFRAALATYI